MWDVILVIIGLLFGLIGFLGSFVPILPGPPFTYIGMLFIHWSKYAEYTTNFLLLFLFLTVAITFVDNVLPVWMTKKYGGSKFATWGSFIGLVIGLFFPPWGILIGSFLGAFVGELIHDNRNTNRALKIGMASFVAFIVGTGAKMTFSIIMLYYMIEPLF